MEHELSEKSVSKRKGAYAGRGTDFFGGIHESLWSDGKCRIEKLDRKQGIAIEQAARSCYTRDNGGLLLSLSGHERTVRIWQEP